ncbi:39S ribosomal protein L42, mitochondrial [Epinephelus fuscoguttatus]|uniref:39S ribosomal protein L42, mitochondrial n=1 Tax=Epinephelus lanceolatus TaxID=310571 RepID=UPI0014477F00|nr:39S ribosomal protein L42, mitochondrial [Epinephelus lanceolatus]XP_049422556.1 39S ribosomal protein L42, mitochondrial [Epinephelus fuscoguttatus]
MASGHLCKLHSLLTRLSTGTTLRRVQTCLVPVRQKSSVTGPLLDSPNCNVEIGATSDGKTIVCYHPAVDVPYELTQPIERPDPLSNSVETHDQILKAHLSKEVLKDKQGPTIEELSKMFFTTKHRWYPVGQYHMRRIKKNPPKDR